MILAIFINLLSNLLSFFIGRIFSFYGFIKILCYSYLHSQEKIRFSISYIFRIKIDNQYLLIKGNRINQYQPIGGVYKFYPSACSLLNELEIVGDENIPIDNVNKDDLRVLVKGKNVHKFLKWFYSKKNREVTVHREFFEELIQPGFLPLDSLLNFKAEYIKTFQTNLKSSVHFKCKEVLIYDIFEVFLSSSYLDTLKSLNINGNETLVLASRDNIERENITINDLSVKISEHSKYVL